MNSVAAPCNAAVSWCIWTGFLRWLRQHGDSAYDEPTSRSNMRQCSCPGFQLRAGWYTMGT